VLTGRTGAGKSLLPIACMPLLGRGRPTRAVCCARAVTVGLNEASLASLRRRCSLAPGPAARSRQPEMATSRAAAQRDAPRCGGAIQSRQPPLKRGVAVNRKPAMGWRTAAPAAGAHRFRARPRQLARPGHAAPLAGRFAVDSRLAAALRPGPTAATHQSWKQAAAALLRPNAERSASKMESKAASLQAAAAREFSDAAHLGVRRADRRYEVREKQDLLFPRRRKECRRGVIPTAGAVG